MKNKGYTLLELLGVIVILSLLVTLVFPSVINFIKKGNDEINSITNELIISAAEDYINDNSSELYLTSGTEYCVSVDTLIGKQYLNIELDDDDSYSSKSVKVTYDDKANYEIIDSKDCSVCKLVSHNYNEIGSKYQCKVKDNMETGFEDGYYFHLLSTNEDGTINLIMERNIYYDEDNDIGMVSTKENIGLVEWYAPSATNSIGPITAMDYLYNATKDWSNVPNIVINYKDEGSTGKYGYGSITTINNITKITKKDESAVTVLTDKEGYTNLKSRMPYYSEVTGEGKCATSNGSCPLWLSNYLNGSSYVTGEGLQNISGLSGYWTFSTFANTNYVHSVYSSGKVHYYSVNNSDYNGLRPVITVKNVIELK